MLLLYSNHCQAIMIIVTGFTKGVLYTHIQFCNFEEA